MLGWRLLQAPFLIAGLIGIFYVDALSGAAAPWLYLFILLLTVRAVYEFHLLLQTRSFQPNLFATIAGSVAVVTAHWLPHWLPVLAPAEKGLAAFGVLGPSSLTITVVLMALMTWRAFRYSAPGGNLETLGAEFLCVGYVGLFLGLTAQLRWVQGTDLGYVAIGSLMIATKCGDTTAYACGKAFGKAKMVPKLSPGKTWAGAYGAIGGAALGSWLWFTFAVPTITGGHYQGQHLGAILFGATIGLVGMIGDLCESLIKRDLGQKDSAPLLPGFGGLLDLLDSVMFAGPVAYLLWLTLPLVTTR